MPKVAVTAKPVSSKPINNSGAVVVMGGNISANSFVTSAPYATIVNQHPNFVGAVIPHVLVQNDLTNKTPSLHNCGRWQPLSGGSYAKMNAGQYVIRRYTNFLAGLASNILNSGCSDFAGRQSIHRQIRDRYHVMYQINIGFGDPLAQLGGTNTDTFSYDDNVTVWALDKEGAVTRAVPGYLVYRVASTAFTTKQYPAPNT